MVKCEHMYSFKAVTFRSVSVTGYMKIGAMFKGHKSGWNGESSHGKPNVHRSHTV